MEFIIAGNTNGVSATYYDYAHASNLPKLVITYTAGGTTITSPAKEMRPRRGRPR